MTTVVPPVVMPPMPAAPATGGATVAVIANPPAELLKLAAGDVLTGLLVATQPRGQVAIETNLGTLLANLPQAVPPGSTLTFKILSLVPQVQLLLAAVDGQPSGSLPPSLTPAPLAGSAAQSSLTPATPPVTVSEGQSLSATVVRAAPLDAPPAAQPVATQTAKAVMATPNAPSLPAGQNLPPPVPGGVAAPNAPMMPLPHAAAAPATLPMPAAPPPPSAEWPALPAGTRLAVRLIETPPSQVPANPIAEPASAAPRTGVVMRAAVEGVTPSGQPVVRTPLGSLALDTRAQWPVGAEVTLQIDADPETLRALASAPPAHANLPPLMARQWPALDQAMAALRQAAPDVAANLIDNVVPKPHPGGLAAALLYFLSAARGGDAAGWIGVPTLRALERERSDLAGRLKRDFEEGDGISALSTDKQWRVTALPIYGDPVFDQARLYVKRRQSNADEAPETATEGGTRFVFDVELSRLGRLQLDGLSKREKHRLDLIVRTARALPERLRSEINALFTATASRLGVAGQLMFQVTTRFVEVEPDCAVKVQSSVLA